ncbi:uncharacterized protein [Ptychodera flava]|uniref:uncharacterized protein n=1 Tax=Ptychodera flava TaxID=63121 RepID=UPI00396A6C46
MHVNTFLRLYFFIHWVQETTALENVALHKVVDVVPNSGNTTSLPYLSDGDQGTCAVTTKKVNEPTFVIDLGGYYSVINVIMDQVHANCKSGVSYKNIKITIGSSYDITENERCFRGDIENTYSRHSVECSEPIIGRYATLTKLKQSSLPKRNMCLCEMEVLGRFVEPIISCPDDIEASALPKEMTATVTWDFPTVTNYSRNLRVSGSHDRGSEFHLGHTVVTYTAVDAWDNSVSCQFTVTLRESLLDEIMRNLSSMGKGNEVSDNVVAETIANMEMLSDVTFSLSKIYERTPETESAMDIAYEILSALDNGLTILRTHDRVNSTTLEPEEHLIGVVIDTVERLSKFVLTSVTPGSGSIIFETPSIVLHAETDTTEEISDTLVSLGDGNSFRIPPSATLHLTSGLTINLVAIRLKRTSLLKMEDGIGLTDVLSLSFAERNGTRIEVANADEDIGILYGINRSHSSSGSYASGVYFKADDVTYFGWTFEISKQTHGMNIAVIRSSEILQLNATVHVQFLNEVQHPDDDDIRGQNFSRIIRFSGREASIIIPRQDPLESGQCYMNVTVPHRQRVKLSLLLMQQTCQYFNRQTTSWDTKGCRASETTSNDSILCLCKDLPT